MSGAISPRFAPLSILRRMSCSTPCTAGSAKTGGCKSVLDLLEIPYTHSGVLASALAMDKPTAKRMFRGAGIRCAEHVVVDRSALAQGDVLPRPYVVKPLGEGLEPRRRHRHRRVQFLSAGRALAVRRPRDGGTLRSGARDHRRRDGRPCPRRDRDPPRRGLLRLPRQVHRGAPANTSCRRRFRATRTTPRCGFSVDAHQALGCRGVSRADLRYDDGIRRRRRASICSRSIPSPA